MKWITLLPLLFLTACATQTQQSCQNYGKNVKPIIKAIDYERDWFKSSTVMNSVQPPKQAIASAPVYYVIPSSHDIKPCNDLMIKKVVLLKKHEGAKIVLKDKNEFFSKNGTLISRTTHDVTSKLVMNGYYRAILHVPISEYTAPGTYRIVSTLIMVDQKTGHSVTLAKADGSYKVIHKDR